MQNPAQQDQQVTSGVNEARFIAHLRELFSKSTVALSEIAQNARRALATKVMFDFSEDGKKLVVTDDGIGIDDFRNLVVIAESGWNDELMADEQPFGIGFASVCFTAERVVVESKGKSISFTTDDLVAKRPILVLPASFIGGTRLTLTGFRIDANVAKNALRDVAKGFAIPVLVDGNELPRPHAREFLKGIETAVGFVHAPGIHNEELRCFGLNGHVYCQGLPVNVNGFTSQYRRNDDSPIVHIDYRRFKPRVPDRDSLIDAEDASREIGGVLKDLMRTYLVDCKAAVSAELFATKYWDLASMVDALDLMCDVPVLPVKLLNVLTEDLRKPTEGNSSWTAPKAVVTRAQVESGEVVLFRPDLCDDVEEDNFARMAFAAQEGWIYVDSLPDGHWAEPHIKDIAEMDCQITGKVLATGYFDGWWISDNVTIVDDLAVTINGETVMIDQPLALCNREGPLNDIVVPVSAQYPASVLLQISDYKDENNDYREADHNRDIDEFLNVVALLKGEDPKVTLTKCLNGGSAEKRNNLRGRTFMVTFASDGKFAVTE